MSTWFDGFPRSLVAVGAAILVAGPVAAQEPAPEPEDGRCVCIRDLPSSPDWQAFTAARRAMLGVVLGEPMEVAGRTGIELLEVRDRSPAGRAGLRGGDVLVALDGRDLGDDPAASLRSLMREVEPGNTVTATFYRGDEERTARIVTESASMFGARGPAMIAPQRAPRVEMRGMTRPAMIYRHLMEDGLELTAVNRELGTYFGTDRGVLVADIDADSPLGLRAGDVILAIDGRDVEDPAHVRAILASYRDGEEISFRIMRERQTLDVTGRRS